MSSGKANKGGALSRSARSIVDLARDADAPSAADRERVKKALAVALAAGAVTAGASAGAAGAKAALASGAAGSGLSAGASAGGVAASSVAASSVAASGVAAGSVAATSVVGGGSMVSAALGASLLTKVAFVVVAVGVTSGALVASRELSRPAVPTETAEHAAEVVEVELPPALSTGHAAARSEPEPSPSELVVLEEPVVEEPPLEVAIAPVPEASTETETRPRPSVRVARREEPAVEEPASSIEPELAVLGSRFGTPTEMLDRVTQYDERFPGGALSSVRDDMRRRAIRSLCAEGPLAVGAYLDAHPSSPHASAIRSACP